MPTNIRDVMLVGPVVFAAREIARHKTTSQNSPVTVRVKCSAIRMTLVIFAENSGHFLLWKKI